MTPPLTRNIYDQQASNKRMTFVVFTGFILLLAFIGAGFDYYITSALDLEGGLPVGTIVAVVAGVVAAFWSLRGGPQAVLKSARAVPANPDHPDHRQLLNVVEEMRIASGLPSPAVFVIPDDDPNAFATGTDPQSGVIAVTQGLLRTLTREELQGVVAHEMSHIRNYDIRLMTVVAALVGAVLLLSDMGLRSMRFGGGRKSGRSKGGGQLGALLFVLWLVSLLLAPLFTRMLAMMVSRKREYLADASAAELTRNPGALASALAKLENAAGPTASVKQGLAHLCIVDPLGRKLNDKTGGWAELFGTHPPLQKRIIALRAMAYQITSTPAA